MLMSLSCSPSESLCGQTWRPAVIEQKQVNVTGECLCGAVAFEFAAPSLWCAHCHCSMCRRAHGAAFVTWVGVDKSRFKLLKQDSLKWYRSSEEAERGFCNDCGSTLFFRSTQWPDEIHVARANVPGKLDIEPAVHVSYGSQEVPWFKFEDGLPHKHNGDG
jgi:hypothetical protein